MGRDGAEMMELEQATRILELRPGATFRQVSEAREDLLALWNPNRMSDHPRLRAKAARKIEEINQAYAVLMEHLGQGSIPATRVLTGFRGRRHLPGAWKSPGRQPRQVGNTVLPLYEEVFSRRKQEDQPRIPVWSMVGGGLLLVLGIVLYQSWGSEEVAVDPAAASTEELPSEPPGVLPAGEPASASADETAEDIPDTDAAKAVAAPVEAPEEEPPAERVVAAAPPREPPPPTQAASSPPTPRRPAPPQAEPPGGSGQRPALRRQGRPAESTGEESEKEKKEEEEKRLAEQFERVFQDLLANSAAARKLVDEEFADLRFDQWNVVDQTDSEIWIELVARQPDGNSLHFTWAINPADGRTRPLSEAARNLERSGRLK